MHFKHVERSKVGAVCRRADLALTNEIEVVEVLKEELWRAEVNKVTAWFCHEQTLHMLLILVVTI